MVAGASLLDRSHDAAQSGRGEDDASRGLGHIGRRRHRDPHLGLTQRGYVGRDGSRRTDRTVESHGPGDDACSGCGIAGGHHGANAEGAQLSDEGRRVRPRRIAQRDHSDEGHGSAGRSLGDGQDPVTLLLERGDRVGTGAVGSEERSDRVERSLDDVQPVSTGVGHNRFRHPLGRVEGRERLQCRRVRHSPVAPRGTDGLVDRILPALGAGERGGGEDMRLVTTARRRDRADRQLVLGQGPGLVHTQDVDGCGLVDRGQARGEHAQLAERAGPDRSGKREGGG